MRRFLTLADVAESLNISMSATRGLVRSGELEAIQVGGRGQWRVEETKLDEYIDARYAEQAAARGEGLGLESDDIAEETAPADSAR